MFGSRTRQSAGDISRDAAGARGADGTACGYEPSARPDQVSVFAGGGLLGLRSGSARRPRTTARRLLGGLGSSATTGVGGALGDEGLVGGRLARPGSTRRGTRTGVVGANDSAAGSSAASGLRHELPRPAAGPRRVRSSSAGSGAATGSSTSTGSGSTTGLDGRLDERHGPGSSTGSAAIERLSAGPRRGTASEPYGLRRDDGLHRPRRLLGDDRLRRRRASTDDGLLGGDGLSATASGYDGRGRRRAPRHDGRDGLLRDDRPRLGRLDDGRLGATGSSATTGSRATRRASTACSTAQGRRDGLPRRARSSARRPASLGRRAASTAGLVGLATGSALTGASTAGSWRRWARDAGARRRAPRRRRARRRRAAGARRTALHGGRRRRPPARRPPRVSRRRAGAAAYGVGEEGLRAARAWRRLRMTRGGNQGAGSCQDEDESEEVGDMRWSSVGRGRVRGDGRHTGR